jgi:hypothetical protein
MIKRCGIRFELSSKITKLRWKGETELPRKEIDD